MTSTRLTKLCFLLCNFFYLSRGTRIKNITSAVSRQIRSIGFPESSGSGIFFALSIPVDIPDKSVALTIYFEANYGLPMESDFGSSDVIKRSIDRRLVYDVFENNLSRAGYPGRDCLLRAICETAKRPVADNGLIGDLVHLLLTPSSSSNVNLSADFTVAERATNCQELYAGCPINLLDLLSHEIN